MSVRENNGYVRGRFIMRGVDDDHDHEDEDEDVASSMLSTRALTRRLLFYRGTNVRKIFQTPTSPSSYSAIKLLGHQV